MRYLPIMGELFSSDSFIFMLIGLFISAFIGITMKSTKKNMIGLGICFSIYAVSEIISNIRSSYLLELILLFAGTLAIGGVIGFLIGLFISKIRD